MLPFQNLGPAEQGYFADGITEEITSRLAMLPDLAVISRTSADQYRRSDKPLKQIGKELGADYILEGSVRWENTPGQASRVRVTPQLIRVSDDRHLWAGRYDESLKEVFTVQSRIAEQVATALDLALQPPHHAVLAAKPTDNLRAYDFYLRGNEYFTRAGDPDGLRRAEEMYTRATELDPAFALAFARLARTHIWQFHLFSERTEQRLDLARRAADSALTLQPDLPEAHLALGQIHYWGELDYPKALQEFRTALAGDPGNGDLAWARGLVERRLGQWGQARADLKRAVDLDPRSGVKSLDLFELHLRRREYAEAQRYVDRVLDLEPDSPAYLYKALLILARDGDRAAAASALNEGMRRAGPESMAFWVRQSDIGGALWPRAGQHDSAGGERDHDGAVTARIPVGTICEGADPPLRGGRTRGAGVLRFGGADPGAAEQRAAGRSCPPRLARAGPGRPRPAGGRHPRGPARGRAPASREGHLVWSGHAPEPGGGLRHAGRGRFDGEAAPDLARGAVVDLGAVAASRTRPGIRCGGPGIPGARGAGG